jgi:hypothetical protein
LNVGKVITSAILAAMVILGLLLWKSASAGTLTFTTTTATGNGSVIPVLSWSTTPVATGCTASGAWSGAKAASGTETLAAITSSKTYNLLCSWADLSQAIVNWVPPTQNTDGTAYTDPWGVKIHYGQTASSMTTIADVPIPATSKTIAGLATGTWFFNVHAVNLLGVESGPSNTASKTIGSTTSTESVGITVNPVPMAPTAVTVN